ncbi:FG-GAP-like repeat-containing protein [Oerskovia sp. M15]
MHRLEPGDPAADWDGSQSVGLFEGAQYADSGKYRPVVNCRMRGNSPPYCPVCYTELKSKHHLASGHSFTKVYTGDFSGDGKDDILIHNGNSILVYRSDGTRFDLGFSAVERVPGSWQFQPGDQFYIGDFNGDGKDEVVVYNSTNWAMEYLGLLADDGSGACGASPGTTTACRDGSSRGTTASTWRTSTATGTTTCSSSTGRTGPTPTSACSGRTGRASRSYGATTRRCPAGRCGQATNTSWGLRRIGARGPLGVQWLGLVLPYLGLLRSNGTSLSMARRFDGHLPGWQLRPNDRLHIGDFDGDGRADLYIFNGEDWRTAQLGMFMSLHDWLYLANRYDGTVPGWQMRRHDRHWVADTGDGRADLFVYNHEDWGRSTWGHALHGRRDHGVVERGLGGEWNLGSVDRFEVGDVEGVGSRRNLVVHNNDWLGLIRATPTLHLLKIYNRWIHNYRHGRNW